MEDLRGLDESVGNVANDSGYKTVDESPEKGASGSSDKNELIKQDLIKCLPRALKKSELQVQREKNNAWKQNLDRIKESRNQIQGGAVWTRKDVECPGHSSVRSKVSVLVKSGLTGLMRNMGVDVIKIYPVQTKPKMICWTAVDGNLKLPDQPESEYDSSLDEQGLLDAFAEDFLSETDNEALAGVLSSGIDLEENKDAINALKCDQVFLNLCDRLLEHEEHRWEKRGLGDWKYADTNVFHALCEYCGSLKPFPYELKLRYERLKKPEIGPTNLQLPKVPSVSNRADVMQSFHKYFCRRCFVYNCMVHGSPEKVHVEEQDFQKGEQKEFAVKPPPCSTHCYKPVFYDFTPGLVDDNIAKEWSQDEKAIFLAVGKIYRNNPCKVATVIASKTCIQTFHFWELVKRKGDDFDDDGAIPRAKKKRRMKESANKFSSYCKNNGLLLGLEDSVKPEADKYPAYHPCYHPGTPCNDPKNCSCIDNGLTCEKYCGCCVNDFHCRNLFPGCLCKGPCKKPSCECAVAARECDADMCGCALEGWRKYGSKDIAENPCTNTSLQKKLGAKVRLAESHVAGWGLFADENLKEGDFIGEYVGELIPGRETSRREKAYARIGYTYLFSKDRDHTVDGMRFGNDIRFINSAPDDKINCYPSYRTVYGNLRISIFASKNIAQGEELFFNYEHALEKQAQDHQVEMLNPTGTMPKKCVQKVPSVTCTPGDGAVVCSKPTATKSAAACRPTNFFPRASKEDETDSSS